MPRDCVPGRCQGCRACLRLRVALLWHTAQNAARQIKSPIVFLRCAVLAMSGNARALGLLVLVASDCGGDTQLLSAAVIGAGALAMAGDLVPVVDWVRDSFLVYPARAFLAFPLVYHYGGGVRHLIWDSAKYKMQSEKDDVLSPKVHMNRPPASVAYGGAECVVSPSAAEAVIICVSMHELYSSSVRL